MRAKEKISKWREKALDVFEKNKEIAIEKWGKISERLGFWCWAAILLLGSPIVALTIYIVLNQLISANHNFGTIWASSEDARYILSALSQAQAAIFGIFFTLNFIIFQTQIRNVSPASIKRSLHSPKLMFIFIVFIISISMNLILLRYIPFRNDLEINIFWPISLSIFAVLILIPYMRITLMDLVKEAIVEEVRSGKARYNLEGVDLSDQYLPRIELSGRFLEKSNFRKSTLFGANFKNANLYMADLSHHARLNGADFDDAMLGRANLSGADLHGAHLNNASLNGANLSGTNLNMADLTKSYLGGANLIGAKFDNADLNGASLDEYGLERRGSNTIKFKLKYDDVTLEALLKANNLGTTQVLYKKLEKDLGRKAGELADDPNIDLSKLSPRHKNSIERWAEQYSLRTNPPNQGD